MNDCQCTGPGWCERHKVRKSAALVRMCQTNQSYWVAWEEGRGPGQNPVKKPLGLGDMVEKGLKAVGITSERYVAVKGALGLKKRCGCCGRKAKLNALGKKLGIGVPPEK